MKKEKPSNLRIIDHYPTWMSWMPDNVKLSRLSIPGSHDSGTFRFGDGIISVWARTQNEDFAHQFNNGVRFFDIRARTVNDNLLAICHGELNTGDFLQDFISSAKRLLKDNPSETIIMSLKQDGSWNPKATKHFGDVFFDTYYSQDEIFYKGNSINPTLGEVRGKIVVFRRYNDTQRTPNGGFAPVSWSDDATFSTTDHNKSSLKYFIQDQYSGKEPPKVTHIEELMWKTKSDLESDHVYINFTSVSSGGTAFNSAYAYASDLNPLFGKYIDRWKFDRTGWVVMDYVNHDWGAPKLFIEVVHANENLIR